MSNLGVSLFDIPEEKERVSGIQPLARLQLARLFIGLKDEFGARMAIRVAAAERPAPP